MKKRAILCATAALFLTHVGNSAAHDPISAYEQKAQQFWHTPGKRVHVRWYRASCWESAGWAYFHSTTVHLNRRCWRFDPMSWGYSPAAWRCTVFLHEYGHAVLGLEHTETGIMRASMGWPAPVCRRWAKSR